LRLGGGLSRLSAGDALRDADLRRTARAVGRIVFWLVVALAVMGATERLGLPVVTAWLSGVANYLPRVLVAVLIVVAGLALSRLAGTGAARAAASSGIADARQIRRLVELTALSVTALVAIEALGIDITFLQIAILVVLGGLLLGGALAFGLGAQSLVADILACHYAQRLYQPGQRVRLERPDGATIEGQLLRVVPPCVILETPEGEVAVPARQITSAVSRLGAEPKP
jgi:hypothetical protein